MGNRYCQSHQICRYLYEIQCCCPTRKFFPFDLCWNWCCCCFTSSSSSSSPPPSPSSHLTSNHHHHNPHHYQNHCRDQYETVAQSNQNLDTCFDCLKHRTGTSNTKQNLPCHHQHQDDHQQTNFKEFYYQSARSYNQHRLKQKNKKQTKQKSKRNFRSCLSRFSMQRQRSASHCPHIAAHSSSKEIRMCCCCQNNNNNLIRSSNSEKNSKTNDPQSMTMFDRLAGSSSSSLNVAQSNKKRSSSLRMLNRKFIIFDHDGTTSPKTTKSNKKKSNQQPTTAKPSKHQNTNKRKHHPLNINGLRNECLLRIFEYFTLQEKLHCERVCHRWQTLIRTSLQSPASLKIGEHSVKCNCQCPRYPSWDLPPSKKFPRDNAGYIIYPNSILTYLLTLCSNLRCLNFSHCYLDDQALQVIIDHSSMIECIHLNDIRLEENKELMNGLGDDEAGFEKLKIGSDEISSSGHEADTITAAMGAFASEQLAVFGGLMRRFSTRNRSNKKTTDPNNKRHSASMSSVASKKSATSSNLNLPKMVEMSGGGQSQCRTPVNHTRSTPAINNSRTKDQLPNVAETLPLLSADFFGNRQISPERSAPTPSSTLTIIDNNHLTNDNNDGELSTNIHSQKLAKHHQEMGLEKTIIHNKSRVLRDCSQSSVTSSSNNMKNSLTNLANALAAGHHHHSSQQQGLQSPQQQTPITSLSQQPLCSTPNHKQAIQRRREWSMQVSSHRSILLSDDQLSSIVTDTTNQSGLALNEDNSSSSGVIVTNTHNTNNSNREHHGHHGQKHSSSYRHLSPSVAPNIGCLQPSNALACNDHSNSRTSSDNSSNSFLASQLADSDATEGGGGVQTGGHHSSPHSQQLQQSKNNHGKKIIQSNHHHHSNQQQQPPLYCNVNVTSDGRPINKLDDIHAFVEQEQRRREFRQSHLQQWKLFAKKIGAQIKSLSLGSLSAVDPIVIDSLLKDCLVLDELRINNEIDILSYLTIIKQTVKRIYINCEHGIGLECVSLLAYRNYAEKVIDLGRVDVPPELIDSVISTIGSNFSNLKSLHLRLHNSEIDVSTPASLLFDNLNELSLQFVSGNVDQPFQKLIQLGWSSVRNLSIQYASITEESVRAIGEHMPQLRKLILHAIEFRCDHLGRRYGHRICTNCQHSVWKCIAMLPHLTYLKLHRFIIDDEIRKALCRMHRLDHLELLYCSNVNDNVTNVCAELARRNHKRRFILSIVTRGFLTLKPPIDCNNLFIDIKVACNR